MEGSPMRDKRRCSVFTCIDNSPWRNDTDRRYAERLLIQRTVFDARTDLIGEFYAKEQNRRYSSSIWTPAKPSTVNRALREACRLVHPWMEPAEIEEALRTRRRRRA